MALAPPAVAVLPLLLAGSLALPVQVAPETPATHHAATRERPGDHARVLATDGDVVPVLGLALGLVAVGACVGVCVHAQRRSASGTRSHRARA